MIRSAGVAVVGLMMGTGLVGAQTVRVQGVAYDSLHGRPLGGAFIALAGTPRTAISDSIGRFVLDSVKPGSYRLMMQHDVLDSIGLSGVTTNATIRDGREVVRISVPAFETLWSAACFTAPPPDSGLIFGTLHAPAGAKSSSASVRASWIDAGFTRDSGVTQKRWRLDAVTDSVGNFALCGVPTTTGIRLLAIRDSSSTGPIDVLPLSAERIARRDLTLGRVVATVDSTPPAASAVLTGLVLTDTPHKPIANAEVSVPDLNVRALTDERGEFRLPAIVPGTHDVLVRRIGYGQTDVRITFAEKQTVEKTIYLDKITALDSVNVKASAAPRDLMMESFAEHKARGFGRFFTREDLDKRLGESMAAVMAQTQGLKMVYGHDSKAWVVGRSPMAPRCPVKFNGRRKELGDPEFEKIQACWRREGWYYPEDFEIEKGMTIGCYARVYLDRTLMNPLAEPYDLNSLSSAQIEAIEWYTDNAQTPPEYLSRAAPCGVMVIHSRRSP